MKPHVQNDAYLVMRYAAKDGSGLETLWNSRDGITPFCIASSDGTTELTHVEWNRDRYEPFYVPPVGTRVFMDLTEERARADAIKYVERYWEHATSPMKLAFASREVAIEEFVTTWLKEWGGHAPNVVVVTPALRAMFAARAEARHL